VNIVCRNYNKNSEHSIRELAVLIIVARKYYSLRCFASSKDKTVSKLSALKDGVAGFSSSPVKMSKGGR